MEGSCLYAIDYYIIRMQGRATAPWDTLRAKGDMDLEYVMMFHTVL